MPTPKYPKPDPDNNTPLSVTTRPSKLHHNHLYGVYGDDANIQTSGFEPDLNIWLWFHCDENAKHVALNNFKRGQPKGDVLFSVNIDNSQRFDKFHRTKDANDFAYIGFFSGPSVGLFSDQHYFEHSKHAVKHRQDSRVLVRFLLITSFCFYFD